MSCTLYEVCTARTAVPEESTLLCAVTFQAVGIEQQEKNPAARGKAPGRPSRPGQDPIIASRALRPTRPCVWDATVSLHSARRTLAPPLVALASWARSKKGTKVRRYVGTYRQDGVWTGVEERYVAGVPAHTPHSKSSSCCADLPCSDPERGCTLDSSIHKTLPWPPSFFVHLITWPSHPSRPNQRNFSPARTGKLCTTSNTHTYPEKATSTLAHHIGPLSSSTKAVIQPPEQGQQADGLT